MGRSLRWPLRSKRRLTLVAATVVGLALVAGAAAYWTSSGSGAGSAGTSTTQAVTIAPATPTAALYPGGTADVAATISNPNDTAVHLPSVMLDTSQGTNGFDVDGAHSGCAVSTLSFTTQTNGGGDFVVPAKVGSVDGTLSVDLTNAISMGSGAAGACQGATFTVYLRVGP
jgi:hypothetical protein